MLKLYNEQTKKFELPAGLHCRLVERGELEKGERVVCERTLVSGAGCLN